jgi:hypothetical protein
MKPWKKNAVFFIAIIIIGVTWFFFTNSGSDADGETFTVSLAVRVDLLNENLHRLDRDKRELVPADGVLLAPVQVTAAAGDSVFDVLQREMRNTRMHMSARFTPVINEAYVEAINNIYAFDAGPLSGWKYSVNGVFPNIASSSYSLNPGDAVVWAYSLDLGRDLGAGGDW